MPTVNDILAVVLGGGRGARLYPLTQMRSKPAVPIAGKYRLIDIPISNCINSNIFRIAILTQFNSVSLHRHITRAYHFDSFHQGYVHIWAAEQTMESASWYQGTADAFRKQMLEIQSAGMAYTLILAGDHLYRMDYKAMAEYHWKTGADITVAVQPVKKEGVSRFGLLKRERDGRISDFVEKPTDPEVQKKYVSRDDPELPFLGSMGIYMFNTKTLLEILQDHPDRDDFGNDIIPLAIKTHKVVGFDFDGYWADIGTIRSFYETNLALTTPKTPFDFFDAKLPIYTDMRFLPGSIVEDSKLHDVMIADGCKILTSEISHSIIGIRSQISQGCHIKDSIVMGSDYYDAERESKGLPIGIGENCHIEGAILDKNTKIGSNVTIKPFPRGTEINNESWYVRDGIVVIPKGSEIPSDTTIAP